MRSRVFARDVTAFFYDASEKLLKSLNLSVNVQARFAFCWTLNMDQLAMDMFRKSRFRELNHKLGSQNESQKPMKKYITALLCALMVTAAPAAVTITPTSITWSTTSTEVVPGLFGSVITEQPVFPLLGGATVTSLEYLVLGAGADPSLDIIWSGGSGTTHTFDLVTPGLYRTLSGLAIADFSTLATGAQQAWTYSSLPAGASFSEFRINGSGFAAAVPEPSRAMLGFLGMMGLIMRRRRR